MQVGLPYLHLIFAAPPQRGLPGVPTQTCCARLLTLKAFWCLGVTALQALSSRDQHRLDSILEYLPDNIIDKCIEARKAQG